MTEVVTLVGGSNDGVRVEVDSRQNYIRMREKFKPEDLFSSINKITVAKYENYRRESFTINNDNGRNTDNYSILYFFVVEGLSLLHSIELLLGNYKRNPIEDNTYA